MKRSIGRLIVSLGWAGLGILIVLALLRASSSEVLASRSDEHSLAGASTVVAQSVSDWRALMLDTYDGTFDHVQREVPVDLGLGQVLTETIMHFPLIIKRDFDPYLYQDNFEGLDSGWPDGSKLTWNPNGTVSEQFEYGYKTDSDTSRVYRIFVRDDGDHVFLTGPAHTVDDFEFRTHVRRATGGTPPVWGDEYGILISPTEIDPNYPVGESIYTFQIRLYIGGQEPRYVVKKWTIEDSHHRDGDELDSAEFIKYEILAIGPASKNLSDAYKIWNYLEIRRHYQTLEFWLTDQAHPTDWLHVYSYTDPALPAQLYIGFYAAHTKYTYDMEYQYDNVYLNVHP